MCRCAMKHIRLFTIIKHKTEFMRGFYLTDLARIRFATSPYHTFFNLSTTIIGQAKRNG